MNVHMKRLLCVLITLGLIILPVQYLGERLDPRYMNNAYQQIKAFHSLPEDSVDVIIYGSSHAWKGFETNILTDTYGISAYNYACNWQQLNTTLLFLKDSLHTQSPKLALIETSQVNVLSDCNMNGEIYYTRYLKDSPERRAYLKQCFAGDWGRYASYYMPLIAFHENWKSIEKENYVPLDSPKNPFIASRGYHYSDHIKKITLSDPAGFPQKEFSGEVLAELDRIVRTCQDCGIEVLFYTAPFEGAYEYSDAFAAYADSRSCTYLNLFEAEDAMQIDPLTDFQDKTHLNESGAKKVAEYLGTYITEHYDL